MHVRRLAPGARSTAAGTSHQLLEEELQLQPAAHGSGPITRPATLALGLASLCHAFPGSAVPIPEVTLVVSHGLVVSSRVA